MTTRRCVSLSVCVCVCVSVSLLSHDIISEEERGGEGREMEGGGREDVFTALGMCVLTSRSCDPRDRSHTTDERKAAHRQSLPETEVFVPLTEEVCACVYIARPCLFRCVNSCKLKESSYSVHGFLANNLCNEY